MEDLLIYNTVDSTNLEAHRLLYSGRATHGMILLAREQTAGKGQYGRSWHTEAERHLAMTLILQPPLLTSAELPSVGMRISLGIVRCLHQLDPALSPLVKWPNDIYLRGKKLCGTLIENTLSGQRIQHIIAGIGMNVNEDHFPLELPDAISLKMVTGHEYDLVEVANLVRWHVLKTFDHVTENWKTEYDQVLFGKDQIFKFDQQGKIFQATVKGVDDLGKIILDTGDHPYSSFYTHEIKWII